eukprot:6816522-Karenia_brevis.AAC.1
MPRRAFWELLQAGQLAMTEEGVFGWSVRYALQFLPRRTITDRSYRARFAHRVHEYAVDAVLLYGGLFGLAIAAPF